MAKPDAVVIVGGGVSGLGLANALALRGIGSLVIEQRRSSGDIDRGDVLHPVTLRILDQWKLAVDVRRRGALFFSQFSIIDNDGRLLFDFDAQKELGPGAGFTSLRHPHIEDVLEAASLRTGLVEVHRGTACNHLICEDDRVRGVIVGTEEYHAPLVVLATGANSRLLDAHFGRGERYDYGVSFLNIRFRRRTPAKPVGLYVVGGRGVAVVVPLPDDEVRIGIQFHHGRGEPHATPQIALSLLDGVVPEAFLRDVDLVDLQTYRLAKLWHHRMYRPGIAVIGDAAHRVHPVGGQGMNLGLADAEILARFLQSGLCYGGDVDDAGVRFSKERQRQLAPVRRQTHMLGVFGSMEQAWFVAIRGLIIRVLDHVAPAKRLIMRRFLEGVAS